HWSAEQLIDAATFGTGPAAPAADLFAALVWRVATMIDPPNEDAPEPPDVHRAPTAAPGPGAEPTSSTVPEPNRATGVERIIELNHWALDYFARMHPRSWAPDYLLERLGTDLADDRRFTVGYAPPGPSSLLRHLTARGAGIDELIDAGLARRTENSRIVDTFRDRIVFPIYSGERLLGFIARRNPSKDDLTSAGPKYLNTCSTAAFNKGDVLFGLTEGADALAADARPVIVEGPFDAIAVTISANRSAVGIAPLGTGFTAAQAAQLKPYIRKNRSAIVIGTDPDAAGWQSGQRVFWQLAALGADPQHLQMPHGVDPADILRREGATALAARLSQTQSFGATLLERLVANNSDQGVDTAARIWLARDAALVIGALPPDHWGEHVGRISQRLDLPAGMLHLEVIEAGETWTNEPESCARRALATLRPEPATSREAGQAPPSAPPSNSHVSTRHAPPPTTRRNEPRVLRP
ncbi:MAG TPA: toprim domain-containing protein, partial [Jiangellaceae bacterium]|nr:toprim domain-containing protein [Jiangellaceae bacterium]